VSFFPFFSSEAFFFFFLEDQPPQTSQGTAGQSPPPDFSEFLSSLSSRRSFSAANRVMVVFSDSAFDSFCARPSPPAGKGFYKAAACLFFLFFEKEHPPLRLPDVFLISNPHLSFRGAPI